MFFALMTAGEQYEPYTSSFCSLLVIPVKIPATVIQHPFSQSLLNNLNICSSFRERHHISLPYKKGENGVALHDSETADIHTGVLDLKKGGQLQFSGAFAKLRKVTTSFATSVHLPVRSRAKNSASTTEGFP
jgi:hypothetical protein